MRVLGVDPSTVATGWGILDGDARHARCVEHGVLRCSSRSPISERLRLIHGGLEEILERFPLDVVVLESAFLHRNVRTALALGEVRGVVLLAAARARLPLAEYSATEVKRAAVGYGAAEKEQVARMMGRLLNVTEPLAADAADALAVAWCHLSRAGRPVVVGPAR
ncbi:MAG: crossover junction endodeoxyribonuclease RuvC [bacterium]